MISSSTPRKAAIFRKQLLVLATTLFTLQVTAIALPPAAQWIPKNAVIAIQLEKPKALLELFTGKDATKAITALPTYKEIMARPQSQELINMIGFIENTLETDWRTALAKLTGGGVTFAVCPDDIVILIIDAEDEAMLDKAHEFFLNIARSNGRAGEVASVNDLTAWTFNGEEAHAIVDNRLILSNKPEGLKKILELRAGTVTDNITSKPAYQAAMQTASPDSAAKVFADLFLLKFVPELSALLNSSDSNPLAALAFAGILEALRDSNWLGLSIDVEQSALHCTASVDGKSGGPTSSAAFALPRKPTAGAMPNLSVPRRLAAMSLYRNLHEFYAAKDDLFPQRTSGLIFFENMMGIFFSGRDLTNEVLGQTEPEIRLVAAQQQYDSTIGTPVVELPAFALVLKLKDPEQFDVVVEEAWQKAIGLINFTRGQQAMPGLIIDRPTQGDTKFTVAYFSTVDVEDKTKLDQRFNFRPSVAMPADYLVLSSTDGLARDLVDALNEEARAPLAPLNQTHSLLEIDGDQLASILQANRTTLVRNDMIKKGTTKEQSEAGIDMMIALAKLAKSLKLNIGQSDDLTQAELELKLNF